MIKETILQYSFLGSDHVPKAIMYIFNLLQIGLKSEHIDTNDYINTDHVNINQIINVKTNTKTLRHKM